VIALFWICLLGIAIPAFAQEKFTATVDRSTVAVGQMVNLTLTFSGAATGVPAPAFPELDKLRLAGGPYTSTSFSIVNGHSSGSVSYTYALAGTAQGAGKIGSASVTVKGLTYKTNPISINIVAGGNAGSGQAPPGNSPASGRARGDAQDVFIRVYPDKTEAYLGEQITLTYKIFFNVQMSNPELTRLPSAAGFWVEEIPVPQQLTLTDEVINGKAYKAAVFRKSALFPKTTGDLEVEPLSISTKIQQRQQRRSMDPFDIFNDPFFGMGGQLVPLEVQSPTLKIKVKPLPQASVPADFSGAVGSFKIQTSLDRTDCKTDEGVTLTVDVSGIGAIKTLAPPTIKFPADVQHFDPEANDVVNRNSGRISGTKTFKYIVIPRAPGQQVIPAILYSYFDPEKRVYATATAPELRLSVQKGTGVPASGPGVMVASKHGVENVATDIAFAKTRPGSFSALGELPHDGVEFWVLAAVPWATILGAAAAVRRREKAGQRSRTRQALTTKANRLLGQAEKALKSKDTETVIRDISASLDLALEVAVGRPVSAISPTELSEIWQTAGLESDLMSNILDLQRECDLARFAAGGMSADGIRSLLNGAREVLNRAGRVQPTSEAVR
jgi:hypothetical protein